MKKMQRKLWGVLFLVAVLLLPAIATEKDTANAAGKVKLKPASVTVTVKGKKSIKLLNNKKSVKWSIVKGKKIVTIKSKKKTGVTVVGKKTGKAKVQAKIGKKKYICSVKVVKAKKKAKPSATPKATAKPTEKPSATPVATPKPSYDPAWGKKASQVAKEMGVGLNLGNTMEAYEADNCASVDYKWIPKVGDNTPTDYETVWKANVTTQEIIDGMKAEGFSTVRIPVFWGNMMENDGTYTINKEYIGRVKEIVDYCQNAGLYAVINIHHFDEFIIRRNNLENCEKIFHHLWTQIAEYFKDYPETLVFEGYNEYLGGDQFDKYGDLVQQDMDDGFEMTNRLNQTFVDAVRNTGGNNSTRVLIASGYWTNIDRTTMSDFKMPQDTIPYKLMVSVHYIDNKMYWSNSIGGEEWMDYIDDQCGRLKEAFTDKDIPVFVGETTSQYNSYNFAWEAKYKTTSACLEYMLKNIKKNGFVPVLWDTDNNFYSRITYKINDENCRKVIKNY